MKSHNVETVLLYAPSVKTVVINQSGDSRFIETGFTASNHDMNDWAMGLAAAAKNGKFGAVTYALDHPEKAIMSIRRVRAEAFRKNI